MNVEASGSPWWGRYCRECPSSSQLTEPAPRMKDKRKPAPYSTKKSNFKGPSKERIGNIAKGVHSAVKSAGSALQSGYGQSSWK